MALYSVVYRVSTATNQSDCWILVNHVPKHIIIYLEHACLTLSGGGGGLRGPDGQTHCRQSETSYSMTPKLGDFYFLSLIHVLAKF